MKALMFRHSLAREGLNAIIDALQILSLLQHVLILRVTRDDACKGENQDCDRHQDADHQAEGIDEMGVLLAHNYRPRVVLESSRIITTRRA